MNNANEIRQMNNSPLIFNFALSFMLYFLLIELKLVKYGKYCITIRLLITKLILFCENINLLIKKDKKLLKKKQTIFKRTLKKSRYFVIFIWIMVTSIFQKNKICVLSPKKKRRV